MNNGCNSESIRKAAKDFQKWLKSEGIEMYGKLSDLETLGIDTKKLKEKIDKENV